MRSTSFRSIALITLFALVLSAAFSGPLNAGALLAHAQAAGAAVAAGAASTAAGAASTAAGAAVAAGQPDGVRTSFGGKRAGAEFNRFEPRRAVEPGSLEVYLVRLPAQPLASYRGGIPGLEATNPRVRGELKLDAKSAASLAYRDYLLGKQAEFIAKIESALNRKVQVEYQYYAANNGLAVFLTPEEAAQVQQMPEVIFIQPNFERQLETDVSHQWIGADGIWDGTSTGGLPGTKGEGIIIGVIDTGINPSNPSFADIGGDSYNHTNPWGAGKYVGVCDPVSASYDATFPCNDKLIGAWGYSSVNSGNPRDYNGHGSHTASTAAGNATTAHLNGYTITADRQISGIAPHANIVAYAACCTGDALSAAIDQIVLDGVDVVNYSIGSASPSDAWNDFDTVGFLTARDAGIFVSTSAGNRGPGASTVGSPGDAPWLMSNAASSHNRRVTNALINLSGGSTTPPADLIGLSFTSGYGPAEIVYAGNYSDALCLNPFTAGTFTGKIVICDRGQNARVDKGANVQAGGAGGFILANDVTNGDSLVSDNHHLPAVHITYNDGVTLKAWVADGGPAHQGTIRGSLFETNSAWGDILTDFSSRGPNQALPDIIKPNITAPGKDVLAAVGIGDPNPPEWTFYEGTSMASPHGAGAAALLKALHPTWTPDEIQSALQTTAFQNLQDYDLAAPPNAFDMGSGRVDLTLASKAGLVLNETKANYDATNPDTGGNPSTLNLPSLGKGACYQTCSWTRTFRSTQSASVTWTVTASAAAGLDLTVTPSSFTIPAGGTQSITVNADVRGAAPNTWVFGEVKLSPSNASIPTAHLPVAAYPNSSSDINRLDKTANIDLVQIGNTIQYTITLTHKSLTAKTYSLSDPILANSSYVAGSATGGLVYNSGPNTLTWSGEIPAGDFVISEENRSSYISMGDLGAPPATLPSNKDTGWLLLTLNNLVYFGTTYTQGIWSVNGTLQAGVSLDFPGNTNGQVPSTSKPNNLLAPWWTDLDFTSGGAWYFVGVTYNGASHSVLSWEKVPIKGTSNTASFQIWFEDGTDNIWFAYPPGGLPGGSPNATVGAENSTGADGANYYYNGTGKIPDGTVDLVLGPLPVVREFTFQVTANATPEVLNQVQMTEGTTSANAYAYSSVYSQTTWLGNSTNWQSTSNWSRNALPGNSDWVIIPSNPSGGNMPVMGSDVAIFNLEIQPGASLDLGAYKFTVENPFLNNGQLIQTKSSVPSGSTTQFLRITNASGAQDQYYGLEITPTSGAMGSVTVKIKGNSQCTTNDPTDTVNRCFEILPTTPQTSNIRFYYLNSEMDGQTPVSTQAWHWSPGSGWQLAGTVLSRGEIYPDYRWAEISGVNSYSPFALTDKVSGPTVVTLKSLIVRTENRNKLIVLILGMASLPLIFRLVLRKRVAVHL